MQNYSLKLQHAASVVLLSTREAHSVDSAAVTGHPLNILEQTKLLLLHPTTCHPPQHNKDPGTMHCTFAICCLNNNSKHQCLCFIRCCQPHHIFMATHFPACLKQSSCRKQIHFARRIDCDHLWSCDLSYQRTPIESLRSVTSS